jgi:hypothetical protein
MNDGDNVCLSGGADGADLMWGMTAGSRGDHVIHFSFAGHKSKAPPTEVVVLTEEQLREADAHLEKANEALGRSVPYKKPWVVNLLRRNYYQVADSQRVYAVATFDKKMKVSGGTAWAVQMFIDLHGPNCEVYVYDQIKEQWFKWMGKGWLGMVGEPSPPQGIWTGIGSRDLNEAGKIAIRRLMNWSKEAMVV